MFAAVSITTPARSGPFCATWGCIPYPYTDVAQFIPGDYFWLIPGILLALLFLVLCACIHSFAPEGKKLFSRLALLFAGAYALVIAADYFSQLTIVMPSLQSGETADLSLFTQYNPHGFFIAGEALGYLLMSIAFLFAVPVFSGGRAERALRWLFALDFVFKMGLIKQISMEVYQPGRLEIFNSLNRRRTRGKQQLFKRNNWLDRYRHRSLSHPCADIPCLNVCRYPVLRQGQ